MSLNIEYFKEHFSKELVEASLTVDSFTGRTDDGSNQDSVNEPNAEKGSLRSRIKIKVIGSGRYGGDKVKMTGSEEDLITYAKRHLGGEGDTLSAVQSSLGESKGIVYEDWSQMGDRSKDWTRRQYQKAVAAGDKEAAKDFIDTYGRGVTLKVGHGQDAQGKEIGKFGEPAFKKRIDNIKKANESTDEELTEASLKVGMFTGKVEGNKTAEKLGLKIKVVSPANPGNNVIFSGDEESLKKYAVKHLGADEGDSLSDMNSYLSGPYRFESSYDWTSKINQKVEQYIEEGSCSSKKKLHATYGEDSDYDEFFKSALKKFGVESPDELDTEKKKEFFNYVDDNYTAKNESLDETYDESACVETMKKLHASGCAKHEMFQKINSEYGCNKETFNKLYASNCG